MGCFVEECIIEMVCSARVCSVVRYFVEEYIVRKECFVVEGEFVIECIVERGCFVVAEEFFEGFIAKMTCFVVVDTHNYAREI